MDKEKLTSIERELVLQYLVDGNIPVTLTELNTDKPSDNEKKASGEIKPLTSQVFPIALNAQHLKVRENGEILLENPPQAVKNFANKTVKVEFYYNRVGLYFTSTVTEKNQTLSISVPEVINRIQDVEEEKKYNFSALIYVGVKGAKELNINCVPYVEKELFKRPVWKIIPLEHQKKAKALLEDFVELAKVEKNIGTGIQLIPVCKYLTDNKPAKMESVENRVKPLEVLFVDHERIVLGMETNYYNIMLNNEYGIKMSFSLKKGPIISRDIYVTCIVNKLYTTDENQKLCADLTYTTIQEEDSRFLYEKATSNLFI